MTPTMIGNPETQGLVRRSKYLEDAIKGMQATPREQFNTAEGTNYNILANAILGFAGNSAADKAEAAIKADNDRLTSAILGTPQTAAADGLKEAKPFDLTPGGFQNRAQDVEGNRLKAIAEMGGPMAALQYQQGQAAQKKADDRYADETQYSRGRDARGDFVADRAFDYGKERDATQDDQWRMGYEQDAEQFGAGLAQDAEQFDKTFGETVRSNKVREGLSAAELQAKAEKDAREAEGGAVFEGPQLATIYNKNMDALDEVNAAQKDLDFIAGQAQAFVDAADKGGYWAQGEGPVNDVAQALSMDTTKLKAITDSIAPLMRRPGSGASSDTDVKMFKSAVTNINNTPEANKRFAAGAQAMADRNRSYGQFLNDSIDPRDPQSRQKAQKLWNMYTRDQPIFQQDTGEVVEPLPFQQWLSIQMGETPPPDNFASRMGQRMMGAAQAPAQAPAQDDISDLLQKYGQ